MMAALEGTTGASRLGARHDFARIFLEDGPGVWRTVYAFTGGRPDVAEEAVAEAFARAIAHDRTIREPLPWIYRTAFRLAKEELRNEHRRHTPESGIAVEEPRGVSGDLVRALRQLSPNQRAAVVLRYEADLAVESIAKRMGVRPATVRVHLHRGRKRLRELLGAEEVDDA